MTRLHRCTDKGRALRRSVAPFCCRLVIMAKTPTAGRAKTRLAHQVGVSQAMRFARQSAAALLQRVAFDPRWQTTIAVTPDASIFSRAWPRKVRRMRQGGGDLGQRMQRLMHTMPPGPVIIVGSDIPGIRRTHIAAAFRRLAGHDAVFGPAADGGYWLVGLRRRPRVLRPFENVRWSSAHALRDTLANLGDRPVVLVDTLTDVDDANGFASSAVGLGRRIPA